MPRLIKKSTRRISIHGHRGSRGTHPENTLPSFEEAVQSGCDYFEFDVHLTKDNVVVVHHDFSVSGRLCLGDDRQPLAQPIPVRQLTMEEIGQFDCGSVPQSAFPKQTQVPGTRIPSLEALLLWAQRSAPQIGFNVEMKLSKDDPDAPDPEDFAKRVLSLLDRFGVLSRCIVQSFDFRPLAVVRKLRPELLVSYLFENEMDFAEIGSDRGAAVVAPFFGLVSSESVRFCHSRGIQVLVWTANEKADWEKLIGMGVDGIITDYPRELISSGSVDLGR